MIEGMLIVFSLSLQTASCWKLNILGKQHVAMESGMKFWKSSKKLFHSKLNSSMLIGFQERLLISKKCYLTQYFEEEHRNVTQTVSKVPRWNIANEEHLHWVNISTTIFMLSIRGCYRNLNMNMALNGECSIINAVTNLNKTGMSQVGSRPTAQKAQNVFEICSGRYENSQKVPEHRKAAFRDRKTLQKFGYSVLEQLGALVFELPPHPWLLQYSSDITSKFRIQLLTSDSQSKFRIILKKILDIYRQNQILKWKIWTAS